MNLIRKVLAAQATVLALWVVNAWAATTSDAIAKRLEPIGKVCTQGKECGDVGAATTITGGGDARSGEDIAGEIYNTCHGTGLLGAPKVGDETEWGKRAREQGGFDGLLAKAISGINAMPSEGTCAGCSNDELKAMIRHMSGLQQRRDSVAKSRLLAAFSYPWCGFLPLADRPAGKQGLNFRLPIRREVSP